MKKIDFSEASKTALRELSNLKYFSNVEQVSEDYSLIRVENTNYVIIRSRFEEKLYWKELYFWVDFEKIDFITSINSVAVKKRLITTEEVLKKLPLEVSKHLLFYLNFFRS